VPQNVYWRIYFSTICGLVNEFSVLLAFTEPRSLLRFLLTFCSRGTQKEGSPSEHRGLLHYLQNNAISLISENFRTDFRLSISNLQPKQIVLMRWKFLHFIAFGSFIEYGLYKKINKKISSHFSQCWCNVKVRKIGCGYQYGD
jgi:hypothetical protein